MNGLLSLLTNHCYAISMNELRIPSPLFAEDISLPALHPSILETFISICYKYGIIWKHEFNHSKSRIVTLGEPIQQHFESMKKREGLLGNTKVDELNEYKNHVSKKFVDSFFSNVEENIDKPIKI